jgi:hypothetical protein
VRLKTSDGRIGVVVDEHFLPKGTLWLLRVYWGNAFYSWVRCHDGKVPSRYTQMDGPKYPGCLRVDSKSGREYYIACPDCADIGAVYYESSKAVRAYRLSELTNSRERV